MERLTYKSLMGDYGNNKEFENEWDEKSAYRNALGRYEDLGMSPEEISHILPKFPIGSIVYRIYNGKVYSLVVKGFQVEYSQRKYKLYLNYNDDNYSIWINDWIDEDSIFQTEEEAKHVLALSGGNCNESKE